MRIVVYGAGAVGVIGGRLYQHRDRHGHEVTLVTRGAHFEAIKRRGLTLNDPAGSTNLDVPVVDRIDAARIDTGDLVVLSMKTQDTEAALDQLARCTPSNISIACAQNGVENERLALRRFDHVYGVCVILPATMLDPGIVDAHGAPQNAILDVGRYPLGRDHTAATIAAAFEASGLSSAAVDDVLPLKYGKLLMNLANGIDALVSDPDESTDLIERARAEAVACFTAAGITWQGGDDDRKRRSGVMEIRPIAGRRRGGGSTWQSFARGSTTSEVDWLNGEIALLGRVHGVGTPVNTMLCEVTRWALSHRLGPRSMSTSQLRARL